MTHYRSDTINSANSKCDRIRKSEFLMVKQVARRDEQSSDERVKNER